MNKLSFEKQFDLQFGYLGETNNGIPKTLSRYLMSQLRRFVVKVSTSEYRRGYKSGYNKAVQKSRDSKIQPL